MQYVILVKNWIWRVCMRLGGKTLGSAGATLLPQTVSELFGYLLDSAAGRKVSIRCELLSTDRDQILNAGLHRPFECIETKMILL